MGVHVDFGVLLVYKTDLGRNVASLPSDALAGVVRSIFSTVIVGPAESVIEQIRTAADAEGAEEVVAFPCPCAYKHTPERRHGPLLLAAQKKGAEDAALRMPASSSMLSF